MNAEKYRQKLIEILDRADVLDARAMGEITKLIELLQQEVALRISATLARGDAENSWGAWWIPQLMAAIDDAVSAIAERTGIALADGLHDAWQTGAAMVDGTLQIATGRVVTQPILTPMTLTILAPYSADLVKGVNAKARETISKAVATTVALGSSPAVLMKKLHAPLIERGTPAHQVAYHAERITRTELSRVRDLARQARVEQVAMEFPSLVTGPMALKEIWTCVQRGPYPCPICRPLHGRVFTFGDRNAPRPPLHPNCRCSRTPWMDGVSRPVEPIIHRQDKKSVFASSTSKAVIKANRPSKFRRRLTEAGCCPHH